MKKVSETKLKGISFVEAKVLYSKMKKEGFSDSQIKKNLRKLSSQCEISHKKVKKLKVKPVFAEEFRKLWSVR